jgi:hypothetical protein
MKEKEPLLVGEGSTKKEGAVDGGKDRLGGRGLIEKEIEERRRTGGEGNV